MCSCGACPLAILMTRPIIFLIWWIMKLWPCKSLNTSQWRLQNTWNNYRATDFELERDKLDVLVRERLGVSEGYYVAVRAHLSHGLAAGEVVKGVGADVALQQFVHLRQLLCLDFYTKFIKFQLRAITTTYTRVET